MPPLSSSTALWQYFGKFYPWSTVCILTLATTLLFPSILKIGRKMWPIEFFFWTKNCQKWSKCTLVAFFFYSWPCLPSQWCCQLLLAWLMKCFVQKVKPHLLSLCPVRLMNKCILAFDNEDHKKLTKAAKEFATSLWNNLPWLMLRLIKKYLIQGEICLLYIVHSPKSYADPNMVNPV